MYPRASGRFPALPSTTPVSLFTIVYSSSVPVSVMLDLTVSVRMTYIAVSASTLSLDIRIFLAIEVTRRRFRRSRSLIGILNVSNQAECLKVMEQLYCQLVHQRRHFLEALCVPGLSCRCYERDCLVRQQKTG